MSGIVLRGSIIALVCGVLLSIGAEGAGCKALSATQIADSSITAAAIFHGPGKISSDVLTAGKKPFAYGAPLAVSICRVTLHQHPSPDSDIITEVWLPLKGAWNGRLLGVGSGGFGGYIDVVSMAAAAGQGFAVVSTKMGMESSGTSGIGHPEKLKDWGWRSTHLMTVAAKKLVAAYYGKAQSYAYFSGCSTGGHQGHSETQRFPGDYNGLLIGDPGMNRTHLHEAFTWVWRAAHATPQSNLSQAKLGLLYKAVMKKCDGEDGLKDGIISHPHQCDFQPESLLCHGAENAGCLTAPQVATVKKIYDGMTNPKTGQRIYPGWAKGGEYLWSTVLGTAKQQPPAATDAQPAFGVLLNWAYGPKFDFRRFDFSTMVDDVDAKLAGDVNAMNPDIDAFEAKGGKILGYLGTVGQLSQWDDALNYFNAVAARHRKTSEGYMAGVRRTMKFYRIFIAPGMGHCMGGAGPNTFAVTAPKTDPAHNALYALIDWVEKGKAPKTILAAKYPKDDLTKTPVMTRPLCPFPYSQMYQGGDGDTPASFTCKLNVKDQPMKIAPDYIR